MYELKTLLPQFDIQLPTRMYAMKNVSLSGDGAVGASTAGSSVTNGHITGKDKYNCNHMPSGTFCSSSTTTTTATSEHTNNNNIRNSTLLKASVRATKTSTTKRDCVLDLDILGAQIQQVLKSSMDAGALIKRQETVMAQLLDLKKQLAEMRGTLGVCQKGPQHTGLYMGNNGGLREEPLHDVVINGHPNFIPYALLALKNAWKDLFTIDVKTFTHSTMADIGAEARTFEQMLQKVPIDASKPKVNVTLIWKNCEHTEMISSPTMYVPIYGEVNILRYLGRVGPAEYRYEDSPLVNEIDAVLDICYQLLRCTTTKGKAAMVRTLNNRLQLQKYFGGDQLSIADIGVHSSLKRMALTSDKDLTPVLRDWLKRIKLVTLL